MTLNNRIRGIRVGRPRDLVVTIVVEFVYLACAHGVTVVLIGFAVRTVVFVFKVVLIVGDMISMCSVGSIRSVRAWLVFVVTTVLC